MSRYALTAIILGLAVTLAVTGYIVARLLGYAPPLF